MADKLRKYCIRTMFAFERVPTHLVLFCWLPSDVWTFLVPAMLCFLVTNLYYVFCYSFAVFDLYQQDGMTMGTDFAKDDIHIVLALERVPVLLVTFCLLPSNVWIFLVPAMFFFLCSNYYYMRCYTNGAYTLYQQVAPALVKVLCENYGAILTKFEKLGVNVKETTERKRDETRNREIQSLEKERKNREDKVQVIKALEKEREKHKEDHREWDAEKKNLEDKVQVMKALQKEREDRHEWDVKKKNLEDKGKLINTLGKEIEKHEEDRHKWEGEKKNLEEKLSSISDSLSEAYEDWHRWEEKVQVTEALEREREKHEADHREWDEEKKNLGEKFSSLSEEYEESRHRCEDAVQVIEALEKKIEKHKEDRRKWGEEKENLVEKLSSMGDLYQALSEEYVESGRRLEGKVQEMKSILEKERVKHEEDRHDWEDEKKNLLEKISVLRDLWRSLSELYKVYWNKWEEKVKVEREKHEEDCRKWEEERNKLIDKLGAATASSQRYRELLHDLDKN